MYRLEIFSRQGEPLCEMNDISGIRWAYDRTLVFEIPNTHPKANREVLEDNNLVLLTHDTLGPWGGYIYDTDWSSGEDRITVTANHMKLVLARRRTGIMNFESKLPGEIFAHLINDANQTEHTGVHVGSLYMGQEPVSLEARRENTYDKIQELCEKANLEWYLDYVSVTTWIANLRERTSRDLTGTIVVIGGYDTDGQPEFRREMRDWANVITAVGKLPEGTQVPEGEDEYAYRPTVVVSDQNSVNRYGRAEEVIEFSDVEDEPTLRSMAQEELTRRAYPQLSAAVTLNSRRGIWADFSDGDVIALQLPHYGFGGVAVPVRVTGREVDPDRGLMTISCEVVQGPAAETLDMYKYAHYPTDPTGFEILPKDG